VVRGGGGKIAKTLVEKEQRKKLASDFREYLKKQGVDLQEYAKERRLMREQKIQIRSLIDYASAIRCGTTFDLGTGLRVEPGIKICPKAVSALVTPQAPGSVGPTLGPWVPTQTCCDPDHFYACLLNSLAAQLKKVTINISLEQQTGFHTWLEGEAANVTVTLTNTSQIEWKNVVAILTVDGCAHVEPFLGSIVFGDLAPFGGFMTHYDDWDNEASWARLRTHETKHFHVCLVGGPVPDVPGECDATLCVTVSAEPTLFPSVTRKGETYRVHHN
jgi:hypothetical protein